MCPIPIVLTAGGQQIPERKKNHPTLIYQNEGHGPLTGAILKTKHPLAEEKKHQPIKNPLDKKPAYTKNIDGVKFIN